MAPLAAITAIAEQYQAAVIVDEAHATGVFGPQGAGLVQQLGLQDKILARVHTFGKAMGCHGAVIAGSALLKEYLINFARSFIYTTALPPKALQTIACAYQWMQGTPEAISRLHNLIRYFREAVSRHAMAGWLESATPIQSLIVGHNQKTKALGAYLGSKGLNVSAVLSPTVPEGKERIRICLHTFNTEAEIDLYYTSYPYVPT